MTGTTISGSYLTTTTLNDPATQNPATIASGATLLATGIPGAYAALYAVAGTNWTITNFGSIEGLPGPGIGISVVSDSLILNQPSGVIDGSSQGIALTAGGTVVNQGTVYGYGQGISLTAGGIIVNGGSIGAGNSGADIGGPDSDGVLLGAGGSVTNQSGGTIASYNGVVANAGVATTVINAGAIAGGTTHSQAKGVQLNAGGSVTNQSGGSITGATGVYGGGTLNVVNAGTIAGYSTGVALNHGGGVTNQSGGVISGADAAVRFAAGYAGLLAIDPGAVFSGIVDGGNVAGGAAVSTLELASGASSGTLSGLGTQYIDFAQVRVDAGASWTLTGANTLGAGTTLTNAGTLRLLNASLLDGGLVVNDGNVQIDPSSVTLGDLTGTGNVTIGTGGTLDVLGTVTTGETIVFNGDGGVLGVDPSGFAGQINGFASGDTIDLTGVTDGFSPQIVNGNTLEIQRSGHPSVDLRLDPGVGYTGDVFAVSAAGAVTEVAPCFVRGTLIHTDRGPRPVESLVAGDLVVTLSGAIRPIRWVGHRNLDLTRHPVPRRVQPIGVCAHAFGDGSPRRTLFLSPEHAVLVDGVLVPVRLLVNGASIRRAGGLSRVIYYHVELDTHDILLAEGLAVESYLETGNRGLFENADAPLLLHPGLTDDQARRTAESCAPFVDDAERVRPIWHGLAERAERLGWVLPIAAETTADPALALVVDGRRIAPIGVGHGRYTFVVPTEASVLRLRSRAAVPSDTSPWVADDRRLGVRVCGLTMRSGGETRPIPLDHPAFTTGWWQPEWHGEAILRRWTDGDAVVPVAERVTDAWVLEVEVAETLVYPLPEPGGRSGLRNRATMVRQTRPVAQSC